MAKSKLKNSSPDFILIAVVAILTIFGLVMLSSASSDIARARFGDSYHYLKHQMMNGLAFGIAGFIIGAYISMRFLEKIALPLFILGIVLAIMVFIPQLNTGVRSVTGAERWLNLGFFSFQPGEFMKLSILLFIAAWVAKKKERTQNFARGFVPFLCLLGIPALLLFLQPAMTIAVILACAALAEYFAAGAKARFLLISAFLGIAAIAIFVFTTPYRITRIIGYFNPESDPRDKTYQINQSLMAIGSGGFSGVGFGNSTTKLKYLPEPMGDSIFAVAAEEFGFIGAMGIVTLFGVFVWRGLLIAKKTRDGFSRSLAFGFTSLIGIQAFVNVAAVSGVIPFTGVPLPFISYGGTALAVFLTMSGILVNISRNRQ